MKKNILISVALLFILFSNSYSQNSMPPVNMKYIKQQISDSIMLGYFQNVDMNYIKEQISDSTKEKYYKNLLTRFNQFDKTLTVNDYRLIYYGFAFQDIYVSNNKEKSDTNNRVKTNNSLPCCFANTGKINNAIKNKDYLLAIAICDSILEKIPVSLTANYFKGYAMLANSKNDSVNARKYLRKYKNLSSAILSSGDGLSCKTAFKIIFLCDEYEIMYRFFEVEKDKQQTLIENCDCITINPTKYFKTKKMWFDVSLSLNKLINK